MIGPYIQIYRFGNSIVYVFEKLIGRSLDDRRGQSFKIRYLSKGYEIKMSDTLKIIKKYRERIRNNKKYYQHILSNKTTL